MSANESQRLELHKLIPYRLLAAIRTMQLHGSANAAAVNAIDRLHSAIANLRAEGVEVLVVQFIDKILFVNDVRVALDVTGDQSLEPLHASFAIRCLGGIRCFTAIEAEHLRDWVVTFARPVHGDDDALAVRKALVQLAHTGIDTIEQKTIASVDRSQIVDVTSMSFALQTYARAVVGFRELVASLRKGQDPFAGRINVVRVVRDLIEVANARPDLLLRIVQQRRVHADDLTDGYAELHAANTAINAILIGRILDFDRVSLLDLGTSALLADVGFAILPSDLTEGRGTLSPAERRELKRFMRRAVQTMIGHGRVNDAMIRRVIVAYEHHYPYVHPMTKERTETHIYSRIVAVADAFDAMTSRRAWRHPMQVEAALAMLTSEAGTRFDPQIVAALSSLIRARAQLHPEQAVC
jgi:HD-GYP domain-containing protein (c-di-GMP phosphodiesterase class II)